MQLAVTIKKGDELHELQALIEALRQSMSPQTVSVLEAPTELDYSYSFPVVTVSEGSEEGRHFGADALDVLRFLSRQTVD